MNLDSASREQKTFVEMFSSFKHQHCLTNELKPYILNLQNPAATSILGSLQYATNQDLITTGSKEIWSVTTAFPR